MLFFKLPKKQWWLQMVCVNIHNCFYICTHRYHQKKNVSLSYSIKSATAKNRAERKKNIATKNHCIYAA